MDWFPFYLFYIIQGVHDSRNVNISDLFNMLLVQNAYFDPSWWYVRIPS